MAFGGRCVPWSGLWGFKSPCHFSLFRCLPQPHPYPLPPPHSCLIVWTFRYCSSNICSTMNTLFCKLPTYWSFQTKSNCDKVLLWIPHDANSYLKTFFYPTYNYHFPGEIYSPSPVRSGQRQAAGETFRSGLTAAGPLQKVLSTPGKGLSSKLIFPGNILVDSPRSMSHRFSWFQVHSSWRPSHTYLSGHGFEPEHISFCLSLFGRVSVFCNRKYRLFCEYILF